MILMETLLFLLHIILISTLCWWYWRREELPLRKFFWHALAAKLSAGLLVGIVYAAAYETSDTFFLFDWAKELSYQARTDVGKYLDYLWNYTLNGYFLGEERTIFFVKITSVIALITYDSYWISSLYFSLLSFFAAWRLTKMIWLNFPGLGIPAAVAFLFFPSCVFWSSGILKETLAMTGLFCLSAVFLKIWLKQKISPFDVLLALISAWVAWKLKYYYIGVFIPVLMSTLITRKIMEARKIERFSAGIAIWILILLSTIFIGSFTHPNFSLQRIPEVLVSNYNTFLEASGPDNIVRFYNLESTWLSVGLNSPWALVSGLFRPFILEAGSFLKLIASIENLVLLVLAAMSVRSFSAIKTSPGRWLIVTLVAYCVILCVFLTISTPNFGTLVRYRVGFLPFFVLLLTSQPAVVRPLAKLFNVHIPYLSR